MANNMNKKLSNFIGIIPLILILAQLSMNLQNSGMSNIDMDLEPPMVSDVYAGNNSPANAVDLTGGYYPNLDVVLATDDYFNVTLQPGESLTVNVTYNYIVAVIRVRIYADAALTTLIDDDADAGHNGITIANAPHNTTTKDDTIEVCIRISTSNVVNLGYNMNLTVMTFDAYENNDDPASAHDISAGTYNNQLLLDVDYFNVSLLVQQRVIVTVNYIYDSVDTTMVLYGNAAESDILDYDLEFDDDGVLKLNYTATFNREVMVKINHYHDYNYNLTIEVTLIDDTHEQNDNPASSADLTAGIYNNLVLLDDDYFNVTLLIGQQLTVTVDYTYGSFDIYINIYGDAAMSSMEWLGYGYDDNNDGNVEKSYRASKNQEVMIIINSSAVYTYNLTLVITSNDLPTITHPADATYVSGSTGNNISWTITDATVNSPTYTIERNGTVVSITPYTWYSGTELVWSIDGLAAGSYSYVIKVIDGYGGSVEDTVTVTVTVAATTTTTTTTTATTITTSTNTTTPASTDNTPSTTDSGIDGFNIPVLMLTLTMAAVILIKKKKKSIAIL
jgi:hypothetical protein